VTQLEFLKKVVDDLERLNIPYMLVGSYASMSYGKPRMTLDVDVVVALTPQLIDPLCSAFPPPDYYVAREAVADAVRKRFQFNILHTTDGHKLDVIMSQTDNWGLSQMARRRKIQIATGIVGYAASPEDIILGKMKYYREGGSEKHLSDMAGIMQVSGENIDRQYLESWITRLGYEDIWAAVQNKLSGSTPPNRA
jgi:hypothetical protein